ncbi:MAG: hypothetical protein IAF58_12085 [Leptolyngbya sp.]|nr:hypothetical protein [Candidatus Melainabacteria bacterium]
MTAELTRVETRKKNVRKDIQSTITLLAASCAGSVVIALYVLGVCTLNQQHKDSNSVDRAAYLAARYLSEITATHPSLGRIGIVDSVPPEQNYAQKKRNRVTGVNSLYATLRADALVAERLNNPALASLVSKDLKVAKSLEQDLRRRMFASVEQTPELKSESSEQNIYAESLTNQDSDSDSDKKDSILQEVSRFLSEDTKGRGPNLIDVRLALGTVEPGLIGSQMFAPSDEINKNFVQDGLYKVGESIPLPTGEKVNFISQPHATRLIDQSWFSTNTRGSAPSAVQIEAVFEKNAERGKKEIIIKKACAVIGGEIVYPAASVFVLNFPHGKPRQFSNVLDLLNYKLWNSQGEWQQVVGTEVPGKGSLAPPIDPIRSNLTPGDALSHALYDWLKQMGPLVEPANFTKVMALSFTDAANKNSIPTVIGQANSCLAVDSGTREYALLNQTNPDGPGQMAISRCFSVRDNHLQADKVPPPSALPLIVDADGNCVLAGKDKFDKALLKDLLSSIYETNLAAIETLESSKQMIVRAKAALKEIDQKMYFERQELNSVQARMNRIRSKIPFDVEDSSKINRPLREKETENLRQYNLAKNRLDALKQLLIQDTDQRAKQRKLNDLAQMVTFNANKVGITTYDLCAHANQIMLNGLARTQYPSKGFLLGGRFVFLPQPVPIQEEEFFAAHENKTLKDLVPDAPKKGDLNYDWTNSEMHLVAECSDLLANHGKTIFVDGLPLNDYLSKVREIPKWTKTTFVLDSNAIVGTAENRKSNQSSQKGNGAKAEEIKPRAKPSGLSAYKEYAFGNIRIPAGQLMYYCPNALKTGSAPEVGWSVAIRDLVSSRSEGSMGEAVNIPNGDWRDSKDANGTPLPGLAGEFQLRCPLPLTDLAASGSYLTNPLTGHQTPQIPPLPPDML